MLPVALGEPVEATGEDTREVEGEIGGERAAGEPDDGQRVVGAQQIAHPAESRGGVHVVERSDRRDDVDDIGSNG